MDIAELLNQIEILTKQRDIAIAITMGIVVISLATIIMLICKIEALKENNENPKKIISLKPKDRNHL